MEIITLEKAIKLIGENEHKIFSVEFIKRSTGELRLMNARLNVKKYLKGGILAYNPKEKNLLPCFDIQIGEYRMINLDGLKSLSLGGEKYTIK